MTPRKTSILHGAGSEGHRLAGVWWLLFVLAVAIAVLVLVLIVIALRRRGKHSNDRCRNSSSQHRSLFRARRRLSLRMCGRRLFPRRLACRRRRSDRRMCPIAR